MKVYKFKCESCGSKNCIKVDDGYKCEYCGAVQDVIMPEQPNIIVETNVNSEEHYEPRTQISENKKSLLIRLLICIFAGYLGVHKFIERKIFLGIVYICTYGLFGIGVFIDVVRYIINLVHSDRY